jgi:hypothetical protein
MNHILNRRTFGKILAIGLATALSGCLSTSTSSEVADAPTFNVDENAPSESILLAAQPQAPNGIVLYDEFEIAIALGNTGGEPLTGDFGVELVPSADDASSQPGSVTIDENEALPSGAARFFRVGPFKASSVGGWELTAGPGIVQVHPEYDGRLTVEQRPDDSH